MKDNFTFKLYDKAEQSFVKISSLNFDESGLIQVSFFNNNGKLIHKHINQFDLDITSARIEILQDVAVNMIVGHGYLMSVEPSELTLENAFEAFGYQRNGLKSF